MGEKNMGEGKSCCNKQTAQTADVKATENAASYKETKAQVAEKSAETGNEKKSCCCSSK
ncbi:MAG: hypothetical protein LBK06_10950 [Planctomycetaceae bacterium]|jgi:hypothetical protein|nr:hypothetical protein [Planctomycetaceae bacterium]